MQRADIGHLELDIDTLKELYDTVGKYDKFYHFSKNVLEPAVKEILAIECEEAEVTFEPIRKQVNSGRPSVVSVRFEFSFPEFTQQKSRNRAKTQGRKEAEQRTQGAPAASQTVVYPEYSGPSPRAKQMAEEAARYAKEKEQKYNNLPLQSRAEALGYPKNK